MSQHATHINADRAKPTCHYGKKPRHYRNQCRLLKKQREQTENTQNNPGNRNSDADNSIPDNKTNNNNHINYKNCSRAEGKPETVYPPSETCGKTNDSAERCFFEPIQQTGHFPGRANLNNWTHRTVYLVVSGLQHNILIKKATSSLRDCE